MRVNTVARPLVWALAASALWIGAARGQEQERDDYGDQVHVLSMTHGAYLGVYISDVTAEEADRLDLPEERGVLITKLADEGPARDAGLEPDDVILTWNGDRVESEAQLRRILGETPAGRTATVGIFRNSAEVSVRVKLGERTRFGRALGLRSGWNEDMARELRQELGRNRDVLRDLNVRVRGMPHVSTFMSLRGGRMGVGIQSLEPQLADYFGLGDRTGVLVTTVREDSPAAQAGLEAGDVILAVDGDEIEEPGDVVRRIRDADAGPVSLRILRDRGERTLKVDLPEKENTWEPRDGEAHGFFFEPEDGAASDLRVEWSEPLEMHFEGGQPHVLRIDEIPAFNMRIPMLRLDLLEPLPEAVELPADAVLRAPRRTLVPRRMLSI